MFVCRLSASGYRGETPNLVLLEGSIPSQPAIFPLVKGAHVPQGRCCLASSVRWVQVPSLPFPFKLRGEVEAVEMGTLEVSESRCESCRRDREANGLEAESLSRLSGGQEKAGALPASPILLI